MSLLDDIVKVSVDIASPVQNSSNFGTMLIIGPAPASVVGDGPPDIAVYKSLKEVTDVGWIAIGDSADPIGIAATVAFSQKHAPSEVYIAVQKSTGSELENITATLNRALDTTGWYAIAPAGVDASLYNDIAAWTEANDKLFGFTALTTTNPVTTEYYRTFGIFGKVKSGDKDTTVNNKYAHVAWLCEGLSYTPGEESWAYKELTTITPSTLTGQEIATLEAANLNYYVKVAGKGCTKNGKVIAGEWIDVIRFRDWLISDMQTRVFNLFVSNPKVPFNDGGISLIDNQMVASLTQGQKNGGIDDDAYDEDGALLPGFTTSVPRASAVSDADKAARLLSNCKFTARLAGAIHAVEIKGNLVYS